MPLPGHIQTTILDDGSIIREPIGQWLKHPDWAGYRLPDNLEPFCRVTSHTSAEVRESLAALKSVYQSRFSQLKLRPWAGTLSPWLTHSALDPTHSGRVTLDNPMQSVAAALEWISQDTLRMIDGARPGGEISQPGASRSGRVNRREPHQ